MTRCSGTPTVRAACPRGDRIGPLRARAPKLDRDQRRAVVRSYPDTHSRRTPIDTAE